MAIAVELPRRLEVRGEQHLLEMIEYFFAAGYEQNVEGMSHAYTAVQGRNAC